MERYQLIVLETEEMEPRVLPYEEGKAYLEGMEPNSVLSGWVEDETGVPEIPAYTEKEKAGNLQNINLFGQDIGNGIFMDDWGLNSFIFGKLAIQVDEDLDITNKEEFIPFLIEALKRRRVMNAVRYQKSEEN